jgi:hypothetical protein
MHEALNVTVAGEALEKFAWRSTGLCKEGANGETGFQDSASGTSHTFRGMHSSNTYQEISMKGIAKALLLGGFMLAAQAAMADDSGFPGAVDDAGVHLPPKVTYASEHAGNRVTSVESAFADAAPDGVFLDPNVTYASEHANDRVTTAGSAFPDAVDDAGVHLPARSTYADSHLGNPVAQSQPVQGAYDSAD